MQDDLMFLINVTWAIESVRFGRAMKFFLTVINVEVNIFTDLRLNWVQTVAVGHNMNINIRIHA